MISYPRIYQAVFAEPWLILPSAHASIAEVLQSRLFGDQPQFSGEVLAAITDQQNRPLAADAGNWLEDSGRYAPAFLDGDGIATIRVSGLIAKQASAFEKSCFGGVGPQDIERALEACLAEEKCRGIVLAITSPGGTVGGVAECGQAVAAIQEEGKRPIFAFADDLMCSAAYWIGAGANAIFSTRLANVGSVGVYAPMLDLSARAAMAGIRVNIIKDGKFKGAGFPGTSLTREQEDRIQADVSKIAAAFREHVSAYRTRISREDLEGQPFLGTDAAERGFVDGITSGLPQVKARLRPFLR